MHAIHPKWIHPNLDLFQLRPEKMFRVEEDMNVCGLV